MATLGTLPKVAAKTFMDKERRRLRARHVWEKLDLNWPAMKERIFTRGPTGMPRQEIFKHFIWQSSSELCQMAGGHLPGTRCYPAVGKLGPSEKSLSGEETWLGPGSLGYDRILP